MIKQIRISNVSDLFKVLKGMEFLIFDNKCHEYKINYNKIERYIKLEESEPNALKSIEIINTT